MENDNLADQTMSDPVIMVRPLTVVDTDKGMIHVIHEITLGDLLICTLLLALISFLVISRIVRR